MKFDKIINKIGIFVFLIVIILVFVVVLISNQKSEICELEENPEAYLGQNFTLKGEVVHKYNVFVFLDGFRLSNGECEITVASSKEVEIGDKVEVSGQWTYQSFFDYYLSEHDARY